MQGAKKKILIVEDDIFSLRLYSSRFSQEGFEVIETPEGGVVMRLAEQDKPDIFIVDIMLQDGNGFEIIKDIRASASFKKTPIVILSNLGQERDIEEGLHLGANEYFVKSNTRLQEIVDTVKRLVE